MMRVRRNFFSSLRSPLAGLPASAPAPSLDTGIKSVTTPSGLQVVTVDSPSSYSSAIVSFRAGSRFEDQHNHGSAAHLAKMLYFANASGKTNVTVTRDLLLSTTNQYITADREDLTYVLEFSRDNLASATAQLGQVVQPLIRNWEVEDSREFVEEEADEQLSSAESLIDSAYWVAFRGSGLAKTPFPTSAATGAESLKEYKAQFLNRNNAVVVGVNVDHAAFVQAVEEGFAGLPKGQRASAPKTAYIGGESHTEASDQPRFVLALEGGPRGSRDYFVAGVVQQILGQTPARYNNKARPGDGLSSRLQKKFGGDASVLFLEAFASGHSDSGLVGVHGQALSGNEGAVIEAVAAELAALGKTEIPSVELEGAKLRLKRSILSNSESVDARAHFFATQALYSGKVLCRNDYVAQIDSISAKDVQEIIRRVAKQNLTFVTEGNSCSVPSLSSLKAKF